MSDETRTDAEHAARIRAAVDTLNAIIDEAARAGISTSFGTSCWSGKPTRYNVYNLQIERQADWDRDYPGEML